RLRPAERQLPPADIENEIAPSEGTDAAAMGLLSTETAEAAGSGERVSLLAPSAGLIEMGRARLAILPLDKPGRLEEAPLNLSVHSGSPRMPDHPVPAKL